MRPLMPTAHRLKLTLLTCALALSTSNVAFAFERQWHLGGGAGVVLPPGEYSLGPALGAHAAYGISDVFDVRLELQGSRHSADGAPTINVLSGAAGLAYKLDIIEWVPYGGLLAGYSYADVEVTPADAGPQSSPTLGLIAGIDYGLSRSFGLGAAFREDFLLTEGLMQSTFLLRAEHRWGW